MTVMPELIRIPRTKWLPREFVEIGLTEPQMTQINADDLMV